MFDKRELAGRAARASRDFQRSCYGVTGLAGDQPARLNAEAKVVSFGKHNFNVPQNELIRPGYAWSPPKNNYTTSASCKKRQQAGPARMCAAAHPAASVIVVCADE